MSALQSYPKLSWPAIELTYKQEEGKVYIKDVFRNKWIVQTPEEWVRQHVAFYLRDHIGCPAGLMSLEKQLKINQQTKRWDILCYDKSAKPTLLVECKAFDIPIKEEVFHQAMRYNIDLQAPYLLVTNGIKSFVLEWKNNKYQFIPQIPAFENW